MQASRGFPIAPGITILVAARPTGPHHGRRAVTCMQMNFDRHSDLLPWICLGTREQIEGETNTNDRDSWPNGRWQGTTVRDIRRGGNFPKAPQSWTGPRPGNPPAGQPKDRGHAAELLNAAGRHQEERPGTDETDRLVANGVVFYRLDRDGRTGSPGD